MRICNSRGTSVNELAWIILNFWFIVFSLPCFVCFSLAHEGCRYPLSPSLSLSLSLSPCHPDCFCLGCVCVYFRFLFDCLPSPRGGADATPLAKTIALVGGGGKGDPQLAASLGTVIDKAVTSFVASARDACPRDEGGGAHSGGRAVQVHNAAALVLGAVKNVGGRDGSVAALAALSGDVIAPLFSSLEGWFRV